MKLRLPHPLLLLLGGVVFAAALTWLLPAGEFDRREDAATGRDVVVAGTYQPVPAAPVGLFAMAVAIPAGLVEAGDVVAVILFVGGAWVIVDKLGTLSRLVAALVTLFGGRRALAIPIVSLFFASMGALENMQEEIIPLVPVLLLLGRRLGVDATTAVAMSAGAAMIGSAYGPTNPFQAGIAMKLAQLPPLSGGGVRLAMFAAGTTLWIAWTMRHATRTATLPESHSAGGTDAASEAAVPRADARSTRRKAPEAPAADRATGRDLAILGFMLLPMAAYVYGALALGWGFNELSAGFFLGAIAAGLVGGLGAGGTLEAYLEGMQAMLPSAVMVGVTRSISLVLADGHVIDTILHALATPLSTAPASVAALLMIPFHAVLHIPVPSVSGHAVLTMPLLVPLSDLLGLSRQVTVVAYQVGAGLTELLTPTNGALMAILLAAGVPFGRWIRFAVVGVLIVALVGVAGMLVLA